MATKKNNDDDDDKKAVKHTRDHSTTAEGEDDLADATPEEMSAGASTGAQDKLRRDPTTKGSYRFKGEQDPMKHPNWATFRQDVENTAAGDLNWPPREPYPTGNPPDPEDEYAKINGFRPGEGGVGGIAGAKDTPKPNPKTGD